MPVIKNPMLIDANANRIYGCSNPEAIRLNDGKPLRLKGSKAMDYYTQKQSAKVRGIAWNFTFPEWCSVWNMSGKWDARGNGKGFCMARKGDAGPYSSENVEIKTNSENIKESYANIPISSRANPPLKTHCVRGHELNKFRNTVGNCRICDSIRHKKSYENRKSVLSQVSA